MYFLTVHPKASTGEFRATQNSSHYAPDHPLRGPRSCAPCHLRVWYDEGEKSRIAGFESKPKTVPRPGGPSELGLGGEGGATPCRGVGSAWTLSYEGGPVAVLSHGRRESFPTGPFYFRSDYGPFREGGRLPCGGLRPPGGRALLVESYVPAPVGLPFSSYPLGESKVSACS